MPITSSPLIHMRDGSGLLVGHVAVGSGVAGLVQRRAEDPALSYTATVLGAGEAVHGGNAAGLLCAVLDGGGHGAVAAVLERAHTVAEAVALLDASAASIPAGRSATLLLADAGSCAVVRLAEGRCARSEPAACDAGTLSDLLDRLRAAEPEPEVGHAPVAGLAALLRPGEEPRLLLALGPPSCAVFIRHWPGLELITDEAAGPEGAPLARLAAAVAQATGGDADLRRQARLRLAAVEAETLREGDAAERMAALMDAHTDDRGAAVRRLVAQSHAVELARAALAGLAVPARPPGGRLSGGRTPAAPDGLGEAPGGAGLRAERNSNSGPSL